MELCRRSYLPRTYHQQKKCIQYGSLLSPCDFQCQAGKAAARNWKNSIRYMDKPLSRVLESFVAPDGKRCCRFVGCSVASTLVNLPMARPPGSQPPDSPSLDTELADASEVSQFPESSASTSPRAPVSPPDHVKLPDYPPITPPHFHWGPVDSEAFSLSFDAAYQEIVHWKKNSFDVPHGSVGKRFVAELARLFHAVGEGSSLESIALKAVFVVCVLLLQKPSRTFKPKDHSIHLERCLSLWLEGKIEDLAVESRAIQSRLPKLSASTSDAQMARSFANLMFAGKTSAAIKLITRYKRGGLLQLDVPVDSADPGRLVRDVLMDKHPPAQPLRQDCLITRAPGSSPFHPVVFDALTGSVIRSAALRMFCAPGPSGVDAKSWHRICTSFHAASNDLCEAMALFARRLCTTYLSPTILASFLSCRLIALDKCPGVRPIGVCEVARRIIAKAALSII